MGKFVFLTGKYEIYDFLNFLLDLKIVLSVEKQKFTTAKIILMEKRKSAAENKSLKFMVEKKKKDGKLFKIRIGQMSKKMKNYEFQ